MSASVRYRDMGIEPYEVHSQFLCGLQQDDLSIGVGHDDVHLGHVDQLAAHVSLRDQNVTRHTSHHVYTAKTTNEKLRHSGRIDKLAHDSVASGRIVVVLARSPENHCTEPYARPLSQPRYFQQQNLNRHGFRPVKHATIPACITQFQRKSAQP